MGGLARSNGRRGAICVALTLTIGLSGCFVRAGGPVVMPESRADVPWLEGAFAEGGEEPSAASGIDDRVTAAVTRLDTGVYRFESAGREWPRIFQRVFRAFLGHCPADIAEGLEPLIAEIGDDAPELDEALEMIEAACTGDIAKLCEEDSASVAEASCPQVFASLRGETIEPSLGRHAEEGIDAYRWVGEGLPFGDDVVIATLPLDAAGAPGWALAEVKSIGGRGHYTGVQVFQPPSVSGDLILLRPEPVAADEKAAERPNIEAWSTAECFAEETRVIDRDGAIQALASCARRIANDPGAPDGPTPKNSHTFTRAAP